MAEQSASTPDINLLLEENKRLKRAVDELSVINDLARAIGASLNSEGIMKTIIHRSLRAVHAEQGVITLVDRQSGDSMKTLVRSMVSSSDHQEFHFHQSLLGWMHLNKKPLTIVDPQADQRFQGAKFDKSIRSLLSVPMMIKSELKGVLTVYNRKDGKTFTDEDQRLLAIIAAQSAQVVENARLYEEEQALRLMQEDIRLAARIQLDLLPKTSPQIPGYDIAGESAAAQVVGGDYFDFIPFKDHHLAFCVGDVSGKGLPASLLMANLQATLRGQTLLSPSAKECIERSNKLLYHSTSAEKFVTMFYGILDTNGHQLDFSNAGHNPPILLSDQGEVKLLTTGGTVLGIMEGLPYESEIIPVRRGDILVVYSDGITEALNGHDEQFGEDALVDAIRKQRSSSAREIVQGIIAAVKAHAGTTPQTDDMTLVVMKRVG